MDARSPNTIWKTTPALDHGSMHEKAHMHMHIMCPCSFPQDASPIKQEECMSCMVSSAEPITKNCQRMFSASVTDVCPRRYVTRPSLRVKVKTRAACAAHLNSRCLHPTRKHRQRSLAHWAAYFRLQHVRAVNCGRPVKQTEEMNRTALKVSAIASSSGPGPRAK